jgi:hypothetical protein
MSFELKNTGATYQVYAQVFRKAHQGNLEAYVNDIVVKSKKPDQLMADLDKTFERL